jgi:ABC-2 type transport system permease protein
MYEILILALREFKASVKTKGFIIGLIVFPIFMGGGLFAWAMFEDRVDVSSKTIHIVDNTGQVGEAVVNAARNRNENEITDTTTGKQIKPSYEIVLVEPDTVNPSSQLFQLSERVRRKEIHAFVVVGKDAVLPKGDPEKAGVKYYSENSFMDDVRGWMNWPINEHVRRIRANEVGINNEQSAILFHWIDLKGMGLIESNSTGDGLEDARESSPLEAIFIPYIMLMLMFMMVMMSAVPLLTSVMEEKTERIAEVLLGSVTPFQFMMGKVLGGLSVSLTGAVVYVVLGVFAANRLGVADIIPMELIPWFFIYLFFSILMFGSVMASLGSACNDSKDAQNLQFPAMIPIILPMFMMMPILREPLGSFATTVSLIPPFTPFLMLVRQASPATVPLWQPIAGLLGVLVFTLITVWAGGKIFRTMILMQGKKPKFVNLIMSLSKKTKEWTEP